VTEYKILARLISVRSIVTRASLLDALWDVVSCMEGEIVLANTSVISGYGETILDLLKEAAEENSRLTLTIQA
jgi:ABC-type maltose transport system permease subunit